MGRKNKIKRFEEVAGFPNVFEVDPAHESFISSAEGAKHHLRGCWGKVHFKNDHPIILELACGKGDYTIALASEHPDKNFIGVDIKGARIWRGAKTALENQLDNVAFLRTRIEFIERFFGPEEISEIWITFPDPFESKASRRLTSPGFIERYRNILRPDGIIHLKTDSQLLYDYTLETLQEYAGCKILFHHPDIYKEPLGMADLDHKTFYEKKHLLEGRKITYVKFSV